MKTTLVPCLAAILPALAGWFCAAPCAGEEPAGLQPSIFVARMADQRAIEFSWYSETTTTVTRQATIKAVTEKAVYSQDAGGRLTTKSLKDEEDKTISYTTEERLREISRYTVELDRLTAYGTDGQPIPLDKLPLLLKEAVPVVVSSNASIVDPFFLSILKEGTLVFVSQDPGFPTVVSRPPPPPVEAEAKPQPSESDVH